MLTGVINVVVVDPNPIFREALVRILSAPGGMSCAGFGSLEELEQAADANWKRVCSWSIWDRIAMSSRAASGS
jgi:hypothetical protein